MFPVFIFTLGGYVAGLIAYGALVLNRHNPRRRNVQIGCVCVLAVGVVFSVIVGDFSAAERILLAGLFTAAAAAASLRLSLRARAARGTDG